ncbi:hypothetical protein SDC9_41246 [bioreactor metagenome]|uniref:DUF1064 domain-containing protein n=1 Tax=bioreactor metagenome TaxID=1076179 RepID=A0A644VXN6_9ZZZZ
MRYYIQIVLPGLASGEITECELQKDYILQEKFIRNGKTVQPIKYVADFYLRFKDGSEQIIDVKGLADSTAKLKRKLFWKLYPNLDYVWVSYSAKDGGFVDYDHLQSLRRDRKRQSKNNQKETT